MNGIQCLALVLCLLGIEWMIHSIHTDFEELINILKEIKDGSK